MKRERAAYMPTLCHRKAGSIGGSGGDPLSMEECTVVRKRLRGLAAPRLAAPAGPAQPLDAQLADFYGASVFEGEALTSDELMGWATEMAGDFFSEASALYDMLSDLKTPNEEGRAMDELMRRLGYLVGEEAAAAAANAPGQQLARVRSVYSGLVRVYIFLHQRYLRAFELLEVRELLSTCWRRLVAFAMEYKILDDAFLHKVFQYVAALSTPAAH